MADLLQTNQIFAGRYRIDRFLAQGGFGAVYAAEQIETELQVALKVLWPHVLHSADAVEKFKLEARVAGRVGSEHIVRVFDAGFDPETRMPFLVMELLEGGDLQHAVEADGPLQRARVSEYFRQIASALDKAHGYVDRQGVTRPIVHRDLKPENIYLALRETGQPIVKVLDFGIAKVLSDSSNVSQEVKGTPLYMAFEQASAGVITPQTDIWALGLIAFYLLTGRCYWKTANLPEASITQLFGEVLALPLDAPSQRAKDLGTGVILGAAFDEWFARCVNRNPPSRFRSAGECAGALAAALGVETDAELGRGDLSRTALLNTMSRGVATAPASLREEAAPVAPARTVGSTTAQPLSVTSNPVRKRSGGTVAALVALVAASAGVAAFTRGGALDSPRAGASVSPPFPGLLPSASAQAAVTSTSLAAEQASNVAQASPAPTPSTPKAGQRSTSSVALPSTVKSAHPTAPRLNTAASPDTVYDDR